MNKLNNNRMIAVEGSNCFFTGVLFLGFVVGTVQVAGLNLIWGDTSIVDDAVNCFNDN